MVVHEDVISRPDDSIAEGALFPGEVRIFAEETDVGLLNPKGSSKLISVLLPPA